MVLTINNIEHNAERMSLDLKFYSDFLSIALVYNFNLLVLVDI